MRIQLASATLTLFLLAACGGSDESFPSEEERLAQPADAVFGERVFRQCAPCHNRAPDASHRVGPNLWGIVGADAARHPDFSYSRALERADLVWEETVLDAYLLEPQAVVPGGRMAYQGMPSEADRRDIIAYLRTLQDDPS